MAGPYGGRPVIVERFPASAGVRHVKGGVLYGTLPCFGASVRGGRVHCGRVDKRMVIAVVMAFLGLGVRTAVAQTGGTDLVVEGQFSVPLATLRAAWTETLPRALA